MEVMCLLGFEIIDITLATSNGAIIICSSVQILQGLCDGDSVDPEQTKDFLLEVMRSNPWVIHLGTFLANKDFPWFTIFNPSLMWNDSDETALHRISFVFLQNVVN